MEHGDDREVLRRLACLLAWVGWAATGAPKKRWNAEDQNVDHGEREDEKCLERR